jgi:hypothetical protein
LALCLTAALCAASAFSAGTEWGQVSAWAQASQQADLSGDGWEAAGDSDSEEMKQPMMDSSVCSSLDSGTAGMPGTEASRALMKADTSGWEGGNNGMQQSSSRRLSEGDGEDDGRAEAKNSAGIALSELQEDSSASEASSHWHSSSLSELDGAEQKACDTRRSSSCRSHADSGAEEKSDGSMRVKRE